MSAATACAARPAATAAPKQISVNGVVISRAEIARETQHHPAAKPIEAMKAAAETLQEIGTRARAYRLAGKYEMGPAKTAQIAQIRRECRSYLSELMKSAGINK